MTMGFVGERDLGRTEDPSHSTDYFIIHPPLQPKLEVANYVESEGIAVPHRFKNLADALSSEKKFIIRSEHPQDYAGASDEWIAWNIRDHVFSQIDTVDQDIFEDNLKRLSFRHFGQRYCKYTGISKEEFFSKISYSYWEYLGGENRTIIADNTVKDRYHIFSNAESSKKGGWLRGGYVVIDPEGIKDYSIIRKNEGPINSNFQNIIDFYQKVRRLDKFAGNHCPIVEVQTVGDNCYFLQYHRGIDLSSAPSFTLDRVAEEGEAEAIWVRGATPENGTVVDTNVYYGGYSYDLREEDAALEYHCDVAFRELMIRQRKVQFIREDHLASIADEIVYHHLTVSQLFKPHISIVLTRKDVENLLLKDLGKPSIDFLPHKKVRVISDGRRAFVSSAEI